uniref:WH2 domain-containing protein n=1 Tax=Angiostrongylus cantonensis TaxID=6313 RepID=A0A0K0D2B6_ANGCA
LQQLLGSKEIDERIEEEDRDDETTPVRKKVVDDRKDDRNRKEKVTVETPFKSDQLLSDKPVTANRTTSAQAPPCSNAILPGQLASSSVVTAMYPPIRRPVVTLVNRPKLDVVRKKTLRALSVDMNDDLKEENKRQGEPLKLKTMDVSNIEGYLNRNVDLANLGDPTLTTRSTTRQDDGKLPNLPNGYP